MTTRRCELVIAALLLATGVAYADDRSDTAYEEGRRLYDLREWDQAIAKFKEAYRIKPEAKSLFNIAQAFRLKGDCVEAINFYRTYKRNFPREKNLAKVDKFIVELEPCAKKAARQPDPIAPPEPPIEPRPQPQPWLQPRTQPEPQPVPQPEPRPIVTQPPREDRHVPGQTQRRVGIALGIVGAVVVGGGVYFGIQAQSYADDVTVGSGTWDQSLEDSGKSANTNAKLMFGLGGAALAVGVIVFTTAPKSKRRQVGLLPTNGGAFVVWSGKL